MVKCKIKKLSQKSKDNNYYFFPVHSLLWAVYFYWEKKQDEGVSVWMNTVEPIRDINTVNDIADYLRGRSDRDYIMFLFGIYSGLRISDILKCACVM